MNYRGLTNVHYIIPDFMPSRQLISDANSVLGWLRRVKVGGADSIFKVEVFKVLESLGTCRILCKDQRRG
jgi:hypothetical protein